MWLSNLIRKIEIEATFKPGVRNALEMNGWAHVRKSMAIIICERTRSNYLPLNRVLLSRSFIFAINTDQSGTGICYIWSP